jgi:hypothetical protein
MSLSKGKFINRYVTDTSELASAQTLFKISLEDPFDQIPSYPKESSHCLDGSNGAQINNKSIKAFQRTLLCFGKFNGFPQYTSAVSAVLFMPMKHYLLWLSANGQGMENPGEPSSFFQIGPPRTASSAGSLGVPQLYMMQHNPTLILCAKVLVAFQAHCVIQETCRRHYRSPLVSVVS